MLDKDPFKPCCTVKSIKGISGKEYGNNLLSRCSAGCQQNCSPCCMLYVEHVFLWDSHSLHKTRFSLRYPWGLCSLTALCWQKRDLKIFCLSKKKKKESEREKEDWGQNPFSLCNYTDKALRIGFFLWNAGEIVLKQNKEIARNCLLLLFLLLDR